MIFSVNGSLVGCWFLDSLLDVELAILYHKAFENELFLLEFLKGCYQLCLLVRGHTCINCGPHQNL